MGISSFGVASSPDGVFWTDHGTMMHPFDEGKSCPQTGSGSGSVWRGSSKSAPPWVTDAAGNRADGGTGDDDQEVFIINYSHGGIIRFMTAPTPKGLTPPGPPAHAHTRTQVCFCGGGLYCALCQRSQGWSVPACRNGHTYARSDCSTSAPTDPLTVVC